MEKFSMFSQKPLVDSRKAAFARLASRVLETLNEAVSTRREEGQTISAIADRIGCNRSSITRALNGSSANMTLRTISDILWAADFDPQDFSADPIEKISPNWIAMTFDSSEETRFVIFPTQEVRMDSSEIIEHNRETAFQNPKFEFAQL